MNAHTDFFITPQARRLLLIAIAVAIASTTGGLALQAQTASPASAPGNWPALYTRVFKVSPSVFPQEHRDVADLIWKTRGVTPIPGASAVYNRGTGQLVIRTTEDDFAALEAGIFKKWRQEEALIFSSSDIEVLLFDLRASDADRIHGKFYEANDASGALEMIRELATTSPSAVRLVGTLKIPLGLGQSHRSRIGVSAGKDDWSARVEVSCTATASDRDNGYKVKLGVALGAPARTLSTTTSLKPGLPRLAGFVNSAEPGNRTAVFLTLGQN